MRLLTVAFSLLCLVLLSTRSLAGLGPWPAWEGSDDRRDRYGYSSSTAGDVNGDGYSDVLVTAPSWTDQDADEGAAFVYLGSATGVASTPSWMGRPFQANAQYGIQADAAGDVNGDGYGDIIVGAWGYDHPESQEGAAFVYLGSAAGLSPTHAWLGECNRPDTKFGQSVASAGDVNADGYDDILVGASDYSNGQSDEGAAFLYLGSPSGPSTNPSWTYEGNQAGANFGSSVSSAGDVNGDGFDDVVIGASAFNADQSNEGRAFLFYGSTSGLSPSPNWTADGNQVDAFFGAAVSLAGDVNGDGYGDFLVSASWYDAGAVNGGRVSFYLGSAAGPESGGSFGAPVPDADAYFGTAVRTLGDVNADGFADVIVGATHYDGEGAAWGYWGGPGGLDSAPDWQVESGQNAAHLGWSVSGAGDVNGDGFSDAIVGIPDLTLDLTFEGAAWVFHGSPGGLNETFCWENESQQTGAQIGYSLAYAGDVNGDGFGDFMTGAWSYDNGQTDEGAIWVWHGASGNMPAVMTSREINRANSHFGSSLARAGDVNGDGFDDVVVGSPGYMNGQFEEGAAFAYYGSSSGISTSFDWSMETDQVGATYGWSVAGAGDVNGDGYADVLVGASGYSDEIPFQGAAFLYLGSESGLSSSAAWQVEGDHESAFLGSAVAGAGDLNGDGFSDVAVIVYHHALTNIGEGAVHVYYGSPDGPSPTPDWTQVCDQANARMHVAASAGDVDGDGFGDLLLGAPRYDGGLLDEGRAWCFHGSSSGLGAVPDWTRDGDNFAAQFGASLATAGDINGDGYNDAIVGASRFSIEGAAFCFLGGPGGLGIDAVWGVLGEQTESRCGNSVSTAGDFNADGFSDVIVGSPLWDGGQTDEGRVRLYLGNMDAPGGGLDIQPRQRSVGGVPIAWLGQSDASDQFFLGARARSPQGRDQVRLEYQVAELGVPLNAAPLETGTWYDTGAPVSGIGSAADVTELVSGLDADTPHHWRFRVRTTSIYTPTTHWYTQAPAASSIAHLRTGDGTTGVAEGADLTAEGPGPSIESLSPNPSAGAARITFVTLQDGPVSIAVHDVSGRRIAALASESWREAGRHVAEWDGRDAAGRQVRSGVYFIRVIAAGGDRTRKLLIER